MMVSVINRKKCTFELGSVKGMTKEITFSFYDSRGHLCKKENNICYLKKLLTISLTFRLLYSVILFYMFLILV